MDWLNRYIKPQDTGPPPVPVITIAGRELPIIIKRHRTAKRLIMRLAPDGSEVRVTIPRWGQSRDALEFVRSRREWLARQLKDLPVPEFNAHSGSGQTAPNTLASIRFRGSRLAVDWNKAYPRMPVVDDGCLLLGGPESNQKGRIERWLRAEALTIMERDLAYYCARAEVPVPALSLSRAQRRWGSCSSNGTIRINWRLIMAPDAVRLSVVAHEVAHLVHFDHSPPFYQLLRDIFNEDSGEIGASEEIRRNLDAADAWLKRHGRALYLDFG